MKRLVLALGLGCSLLLLAPTFARAQAQPIQSAQIGWYWAGFATIGQLQTYFDSLPSWAQPTAKIIRNPGRQTFESCVPEHASGCFYTNQPWVLAFQAAVGPN